MGDGDSCLRESFNEYNDGCDNGSRNGFQKWCKCGNVEKYKGRIYSNTLHDQGVYTRIRGEESYIYEGSFYANNFEGYARVIAADSTYFEGLFKSNKRFGPGVLTYTDGTQDVGMWHGFDLIRLSRLVQPEWIPSLGCSDLGNTKLLKYREIVPIEKEPCRNKATEVLNAIRKRDSCRTLNYSGYDIIINDELSEKLYNKNVRNMNSLYFDKTSFDEEYFRDFDYYIDVVSDDHLNYTQQIWSSHDHTKLQQSFVEGVKEHLCESPDEIEDHCERELITQKCKILQKIVNYNTYRELHMKQVRVTHLLAWNNTESLIAMLQHTFHHRRREDLVNFDVDALIRAHRSTFAKIGDNELACTYFLSNCSRGDLKAIKNSKRRINPDISDAKGNTGMMYAAARDKIHVIKYLTELGANMDYENDEGLTPLSMSLLRYLALLNNVTNWEKAFLLDSKERFVPEENHISRERASLLSSVLHSCLSNLVEPSKSIKSVIYNSSAVRFKDWFTDDMGKFYNLLNLQKPEEGAQDFQKQYDYDPTSRQEYIFKTNFPRESKKSKHDSNTNVNVVSNTISVLLHCGADPNLSNVPLPALIVGLFIGDALIFKKLLDHGGKVNLQYSEDKLTPLHVLTSLPLTENQVILCKLLMEYEADPNLRCSNLHWPEQKSKLIGNFDASVLDKGKTPLHILAMREDFTSKNANHFNEIVHILINHNGSLSLLYLGHSPLSLSVLKGNANLVETFLKMGDDPNRILSNGLGTALTIYILKRYSKKLPQLKTCQHILDLLVYHGGYLLKCIGQYRNVSEFMVNEKVKGTNPKRLAITKYLKKLIKSELLKYYRTKAFLHILQIIDDDNDNDYCKNVVNFLTPHEALSRINFLITKNLLNSRRIIEKCFDFIIRFGAGKTNETVSTMISRLEHYKGNESFGFDQDEDDYVVCFTCGLKANKVLLVCPKCKMVYFCSQICNKADASGKSGHPCKFLFYNDELVYYEKCLLSGIPYVVNGIGGIQDLGTACANQYKQLEAENSKFDQTGSKSFRDFDEKLGSSDFTDRKTKDTFLNTIAEPLGKNVISKEIKRQEGGTDRLISKRLRSKEADFDNLKYLNANKEEIDNRGKGKSKQYSASSHRTSELNINYTAKTNQKGSNRKTKFKSKATFFNSTNVNKVNKLHQHTTAFNNKKGITPRKKNLYGTTTYDNIETNKNTFTSGKHDTSKVMHLNDEKHAEFTEMNRLSKQHIEFINELSNLYPELNLFGLSKPFVCFREGQLYYKFPSSNKNTYFCSTYTSS